MTTYNNSTIENKTELDRFKTDIDFIGYLVKNDGYQVDNSISSNSTTGLVNESSGSKIFIKTLNNGHQIFSDKKAPLDSGKTGGSIIDYLQSYKKLNLGEIRKELRPYLTSGIPSVSYSQITNRVKKELPVMSEEYFKFMPIRNTTYLNSRGISDETIKHPTFEGRIGEKQIKSATKDTFYNSTVFPMYENISNKITGLEVKNEFYSGSYAGSNKTTGFWKSNAPSGAEKPTAFIGEAPIDHLAHFQMHNKGNKQNLIYYATNGEIGGDSERLKVMKNYFEPRDNQFAGYKLGNDNDAAGVRFNINLIGNINLKDTDIRISIKAEADQNFAKITVVSDDLSKIEKFKQDANKENNKLKLTTDQNMQYRNFQITQTEDGKHKLTFLMNNRKDNLLPIEELSKKHRNSPFVIERSVEKDFTKDLEVKLGIVRTEVEYSKNDSGKSLTYSVWKKEPKTQDKNSPGMER